MPRVWSFFPNTQDPTPNTETLFGEGPSRILISVRPERRAPVEARLAAAGVPWEQLGTVGGQKLVIGDVIEVAVSDLEETWEHTLPEIMGQG
jgi:phosphoribosylformylglycinamidine synthase